MAALHQTDYVMNFGNTTEYHLPSKVVDYLYLNKPLVNFISTTNDSTKAFFSDKHLSILNLELGQDKLQTVVDLFKKFVLETEVPSAPVRTENITAYTPEVLAKAYLS